MPDKRSTERRTWDCMRQRCGNPNAANYAYYGGRGITICERWNSFDVFLQDMGPKPTPKHSIERVDRNGNYEPDNCRWATQSEQLRNRRPWKCSPFAKGKHGPTLDVEKWNKGRAMYERGLFQREIADELGVTQAAVSVRAKADGWERKSPAKQRTRQRRNPAPIRSRKPCASYNPRVDSLQDLFEQREAVLRARLALGDQGKLEGQTQEMASYMLEVSRLVCEIDALWQKHRTCPL